MNCISKHGQNIQINDSNVQTQHTGSIARIQLGQRKFTSIHKTATGIYKNGIVKLHNELLQIAANQILSSHH